MKTTKLFGAFLILLLTTLGASAQNSSKLSGSLLWKVSGNGLTKPSYIFGTHHLANVDFTKQVNGFDEALNGSEQVVGELMMNDMPALQTSVMQNAMLPAPYSYKTLLSPVEYHLLDSILISNISVGMAQLGQLHPAVIAITNSVSLYSKAFPGFNMQTHISIDQFVQTSAVQNNKSVIGLETVEDQVNALFKSESIEKATKSLLCSVSNTEFGVESMILLDKYYREANLFAMYDLGLHNPNDPCPMSEKLAFELLKKRNDNWLAKLPEIMKNKPSFIAVGALHLAGEEGLLYQLQKMGYTVEAVR